MNSLKIKKGDKVKVIAGKDKGKVGAVLRTLYVSGRVMVEGVNLYKKHVRPRSSNEKGQVIIVPRSLALSNVALLCASCGKTTRIKTKITDKKKERTCHRCNATL